MNRLLEIGFEVAGHWGLIEDKLVYQLSRHSTQTNILYAFASEGEIKYVGKTVQMLARRMAGYRMPAASQWTNVRNNQRIRDIIGAGGSVEILALPDNGLMHYGKFHLNLAAGLEDDIIRSLAPPWNGGRKEVADEPEPSVHSRTLIEPVELASAPLPPPVETFALDLQPTYYRRGFFNVTVSNQQLFGSDGETIGIFVGDSLIPILGYINRSANKNHTPRIMGGVDVRNWFVANAVERTLVQVAVLSPNSIQLKIAAN